MTKRIFPDIDGPIVKGRETDALIARLFFDWQWVKKRQLGGTWLAALVPGETGYMRAKWAIPQYTQPATADDKRLDDWDQIHWWDENDKSHRGFPHFTTSDADALLLVEKITANEDYKHPVYYKLTYRWMYEKDIEEDPENRFHALAVFDWKLTGDSHPLYPCRADTIAFATCIAALKYALEMDGDEEE